MSTLMRSKTKIFVILISIFVALAGSLAAVLAFDEPTTAMLDSDIASVQAQLDTAQKETEKYSGGLVKAQIDLRIAVLQTTHAMLDRKRNSLIRRITLNYSLPPTPSVLVDQNKLAGIEQEIALTKSRIDAAKTEASAYSGGLLLALILARQAQEELTLASLEAAKISVKYGIPMPLAGSSVPAEAKPEKKTTPSDPEKDKDAL